MLTAAELEQVRDEVGDQPDDAALQEIYGRVGTLGGTIYSVLARRLANLRASPAQFAVTGEYSQSTQANIAALEAQLARWAAFAPIQPDTLGVMRLVPSRSRVPRRDPNRALDVEA